MKTLVFALLAAVLSASCHAQKQPKVDWSKWAPLIADGSARALDVYSTHRMLECECNRELELPNSIASHSGAMAAYSAGFVAMDCALARELRKHHHDKLAILLPSIDAEVVGFMDMRNLMLPTKEFKTLPGKLPTHLK